MQSGPFKKSIQRLLFFFLFLFANVNVFAQRYSISPADTDTMIDFAPAGHYSHFIFFIDNLTDGELVFHWQQIQADIPSGWIVGMCDYGHCYAQLGMSGTMDTLSNLFTGIFAVGVDPQHINGEAIVRYALWEAATPNEIDTITWIISSNTNTGILEAAKPSITKNELLITPNPANQFLSLAAYPSSTSVEIYNALGQLEIQKENTGGLINIEALSEGFYTLRLINQKGETEKSGRFFKMKQ